MSAPTLQQLAEHAPELREPWPKEALNNLITILDTGDAAIGVIEALDRTGLWGRLIPEWGAVRDLPPRDAVHTWTVDRHLVEAARIASGFTTRVGRPDLLMLGALIHDIGKGRGGDHSIVGAELAVQIGNRLGMWPSDVATLSAIVRHHLLLPDTAMRRDISDPDTVRAVVAAIDGDGILLDILQTLAEADSLATGPGVWNDWKSSLIGELVRRCRSVLRGEELPRADEIDPELQELAASGGVHVRLSPLPGGHTYSVQAVAPDQRGLLSAVAGVLALHSLRVLSASLVTTASGAADTFLVSPRFGAPPEPGLLRQDLIRALSGGLDVIKAVDKKERDAASFVPSGADKGSPMMYAQAPPRVLWFDSDAGPIVELRAEDRAGLLTRLARAFDRAGVDVRWAKVSTLGTSVVDVFGVDLGWLDSPERRNQVSAALLSVVPGVRPKPPAQQPGVE